MQNKKFTFNLLSAGLFTLASIQCGSDIPFDEEFFLARPVGLQVNALSDRRFEVLYTVQNQEKTFDGYNLYVSRQTIGEGELDAAVKPIIVNGSLPSFQHGPEDFNPNLIITQIIRGLNFGDSFQFLCEPEPPITYYFKMTAHSRKGFRSLGTSNEVTAVCQP